MKQFLIIFTMAIFLSSAVKAQTPYTSTVDDEKVVILNGIITKQDLENNATFTWYKANQNGYSPDASIIDAMKAAKDKYQFVIFGGTWCSDTQFILPKFFKLQEDAGIADSKISFFGVNREKQTLGNMAAAFKITNVPTIIVMKDGAEVGRVVEYGKTGKWDKELADLLK